MDFARPIDDGHHLVLILFLPDLSKGMTTLVWIIAIHNVFASLQDVSVDALAVDLLPEKNAAKPMASCGRPVIWAPSSVVR